MLDIAFVRPVGDARNRASWPFPVQIDCIMGAFAQPVVNGHCLNTDAFVAAGRGLVAQGVGAIMTTCGFLVRYQLTRAGGLPISVEISSLLHVKRLQQAIGDRGGVAILTIGSAAFDRSVRAVADIPADVLVFTLARQSHFVFAIMNQSQALDVHRAEAERVELARGCQLEHPSIGLCLFEWANTPPHATVSRATGLPAYDALTLGRELYEATNS